MNVNKIFNNQYLRIDLSKNTKPPYYLRNILIFLTPSFFYQNKLQRLLTHKKNIKYIEKRVNYYNKIEHNFTLKSAKSIKKFKKEKKKTYFFDLYKYLTYFNENFKITYLFGDIVHVPEEPTLLKSRPISDDNKNSVLLNLDKVRHFIFLDDAIQFEDKKDLLVWRGKAHQEHRKYFLNKFYTHPLCDVGQIVKRQDKENIPWEKPKMSLKEQLNYKFILAIEGNDVASNLKWVMSSNSLAFMTKPKYETWFMEGTLLPNHHYVLLKDDYSDLEEKIQYYSKHLNEAQEIIANAHAYIAQFKNQKREDIIALKVLEKYFYYASQPEGNR
ncbi:MAG: LpsA protein [uncultured Sulfurovum sp.]|uniref:LpsA protein n=1 Tax=uncultured Sulfurovum sp. TaxID=269237 RepID=A0A6S6TS95_9BACT|nr:MAG: LpsA protein [uncultured Sulfurovum sp.]